MMMYMASPCKIGWENMEGDDRVRFCGGCSKNVYNISEFSRTEAEAFLREHGVSKCVRFYRRRDGTVITNDCPVGLRKIRDGARAIARFAASIIGICLSFTASFAREPSSESSKESELPLQSAPPSQSGLPSPFPSRTQLEIADGFIGFRHQKSTYLPPYAVLTTGKYALSDEISKTDVGGNTIRISRLR